MSNEQVDPSMAEGHGPPRTEDESWADNVRHMTEAVIGMPPKQAAKVVAMCFALLPLANQEQVKNFIGVPPKSQMGLTLDLLAAARSFIDQNDVGMKNAGGWLEHAVELLEAKIKRPDL